MNFEYTGHPLVDVGIATIVAFAEKEDPSQLTEADLQRIADYITREYTRPPLQSFLTVAFPNSGFNQYAFEKTPQRRLDYAERVLRSYVPDVPKLDERCVFTGRPAVARALGDKEGLPPGRAFRQHIPLLTGENVINFHPYGNAGLPVSGEALLAIQAFPLGCAKCAGRLLAVHSDNPALILHFARTFLAHNRTAVLLAQEKGESKMPEMKLVHRTLLIDTLLKADQMQFRAQNEQQAFSLTAYHLSNSGQGPGLDIYHLPYEIIGFLREMYTARYQQKWAVIVRRAWETPPPKRGGKESPGEFEPRRNWLYEDLFTLPENAARFLRTYFLRAALRFARAEKGDPRGGYSTRVEADLVSWEITAVFLRRIMHMEKERIAEIRKLGDRLAEYIYTQNDRRFFREFYLASRYDFLRTALIKASLAEVRRGRPPLVELDPYLAVFEEGDELARSDWRLARDLILIRVIEQLYDLGWLKQNQDAISEQDTAEETTSDEAAAESM